MSIVTVLPVRASSDPCNIVYRGPYAASELETQAMSQALLGLRSRLFTYFNVHSYAQTWFVRWSYSREPAELYNETVSYELTTTWLIYIWSKW